MTSRCAAARDGSLPQAILSKAFAGELVPTEYDLARAEGRDLETADQVPKRASGEAETPTWARTVDESLRNRHPQRQQRIG